jgi:hypothetical protein
LVIFVLVISGGTRACGDTNPLVLQLELEYVSVILVCREQMVVLFQFGTAFVAFG